MRFVLPLAAAVLPVVIAPGFLFYFDVTPKLLILLIAVAAGLIAWRGDLPLGTRRNRLFLLLLLAEGLSLAISTVFSTHPDLSLNGGNWRRFGLVSQLAILLLAALVATDCAAGARRVGVYLKAIAAGGIPVALYTILQYFGWDPFLPAGAYHVGDIVRPPSTLGHADYLAAYLVFVVFACVGLWAAREWRLVAIASAALACVAIVMSGSRAALLGLATGGIVILIARGRAVPRIAWIGLAGFIAAAAVFYFTPAGQALRNRVHWISEEPAGGARPFLWRDSIVMSAAHPIFGYGPETFLTEFPRHESRDLARAFPDFLHESPHNIFLDALVSQGAPGVLILGALCVWGVMALRRSPALAAALAGAGVALLFTSFVLPTAFFFFLTLALLVEPGPTKPVRYLRLAAAFCAAILAFYAARFFVADRSLASANYALDHGDLDTAMSSYNRASEWSPAGSSADVYYSRRLADFASRTSDLRLRAQALRAGYTAALNATRTSEQRSNAWYNMAVFLSTTGSPSDVEHALQESIAAAPNWYQPHWKLAQLYQAESRLEDARREAETAFSCNGRSPEILSTLENIRAVQRH